MKTKKNSARPSKSSSSSISSGGGGSGSGSSSRGLQDYCSRSCAFKPAADSVHAQRQRLNMLRLILCMLKSRGSNAAADFVYAQKQRLK